MPGVLPPGIRAPHFTLPSANSEGDVSLESYRDRRIVLIFFPSSLRVELVGQLAAFQDRHADFQEQGAALLGISDARPGDLRRLAQEKGIRFTLLSDAEPARATAHAYGAATDDDVVLPTVLIVDERGVIRRVYEAAQYPNLPNPMMVIRAVRKLAGLPKPAPVSEDDWRRGPLDAPVAVIEYADYECRPCGEAYRILKQVLPCYGDRVVWVHRHLPLRHSHPLAQEAAEAAEAAGAQDKFWEMHDRLFEARGALEREQLVEYARELGMDVERFSQDLNERRWRDAVNEGFKHAVRNGIKLPPALFVNGMPLEGPRTQEAISAKIEELLAFA